jgi:adhesin transport system outer membrane protein
MRLFIGRAVYGQRLSFRALAILTTAVLLAACGGSGVAIRETQPLPADVAPPSSYVSLTPEGSLHSLAGQLDAATIQRSAIVQEERVARARLVARGYDRYPQVRPSGSLELEDGPQATVGPSVEQVVFDAGRSRAAMGEAEIGVVLAGLRAWIARNEGVYEGLRAYVDMSRYQARLRVYGSIEDELAELNELLELRASGGVSDRGELLRMNVALQELQREIVGDTAALRQARSDLVRHLPGAEDVRPLRDLAAATEECRRSWPAIETPMDALARVQVDRTRNAEDYTRAQRLPRLVLGAGAAVTSLASAVTPGVSVNVDASDMLGMGGRARVEAAELESEATLAAYETQRMDTQAELARLEANHAEYQDGLRQLRRLQRSNRETVDLYREQLAAGSIPLVEGIALYREVTQTEIDIIDLHADALINCLRSSQVRGLLAPYASEDATVVSTSDE